MWQKDKAIKENGVIENSVKIIDQDLIEKKVTAEKLIESKLSTQGSGGALGVEAVLDVDKIVCTAMDRAVIQNVLWLG